VKLPAGIAEALGEIKPIHPALRWAERECQGAAFHSPKPLDLHETKIGPDRVVDLCGTCLANLNIYMDIKRHFGGEIPWSVRREFGNRLRSIGDVAE
jgi:hypothetical protein